MISFPSRYGAMALVLTAGLVPVATAQAQTAEQMVHTDANARHIAPHDTFYTLGYDSVQTDKGVEGFPPGTEVHLVSVNKQAHTLTVTDGHANVELAPDKLTNDMDIAALVRAKDNANQARIAAYQQAEAKAYQDYQKMAADYTNKDLERKEQNALKAEKAAEERNSTFETAQGGANNSYDASYYNQGGNGYGSPYGYFVDLNPTNVSGGGKGSVPSAPQVTGQAAGRTGGANTGTLSTGGGGGKK